MNQRVQRYSFWRDGQSYIAPNFQVKEFRCNDGSDEILIDLRLVHILQLLRDHFGEPVKINSAYRTETHNAAVGGVKNSQHLYGTAADIMIQGVMPGAVYKYAGEILGDSGGLGLYPGFVHIDTRPERSRWTG